MQITDIHILNKCITFMKREAVMFFSLLLAIGSMFFVAPSGEYLGYIDFRTLSLLLGLMLVMAGLRHIGVFRQLGIILLEKTANTRQMAFVLVFLCFTSSMLITNDVALITFVPFTLEILSLSKEHRLAVPIIVLQTLAANLGSMLTPLGNPQNLYLYSLSNLPLADFIEIMLPFTLVSMCMLIVACLFIKKQPVQMAASQSIEQTTSKILVCMYLMLFAVCLFCVLRLLPYQIMIVVVLLVILIFDRKNLIRADYCLLLTFTFLFIFIGNLSHMEAVSTFLASFIKGQELLAGVLSSQIISNVPAAILLSGFTDNYHELLIGVNIGGLGTLIASMASLISFKLFGETYAEEKGRYLLYFTMLNVMFLAVLYGVAWIGK